MPKRKKVKVKTKASVKVKHHKGNKLIRKNVQVALLGKK